MTEDAKNERNHEAQGYETEVRIFSFFTGAGFLDLGFEDAGFVPMR